MRVAFDLEECRITWEGGLSEESPGLAWSVRDFLSWVIEVGRPNLNVGSNIEWPGPWNY